MKKIFFLFTIVVFCSMNLVQATPPSNIEMAYDLQKGNLHIGIAHAAHDPREHHIRKVEVSVNNEKVIQKYFPTQTTPASLIVDFPLAAQAGDEIRVLAICSEAGRKEERFIVPKEGKEPLGQTPKPEPQPEQKSKNDSQKSKSSY